MDASPCSSLLLHVSMHAVSCGVVCRAKEDKRLLYEARIKALAGDDT